MREAEINPERRLLIFGTHGRLGNAEHSLQQKTNKTQQTKHGTRNDRATRV